MIDYDKANVNKPLIQIDKYIKYYENRIKELLEKRSYIKFKKDKSKNIINKIISGEIKTYNKKIKLCTKHPENINDRISYLNNRIKELEYKIKTINKYIDDKFKYDRNTMDFREFYDMKYITSDEAKAKICLEKSLYNHKTKLNRYLQIRNKLDKGE
jgi:hypothetical protein